MQWVTSIWSSPKILWLCLHPRPKDLQQLNLQAEQVQLGNTKLEACSFLSLIFSCNIAYEHAAPQKSRSVERILQGFSNADILNRSEEQVSRTVHSLPAANPVYKGTAKWVITGCFTSNNHLLLPRSVTEYFNCVPKITLWRQVITLTHRYVTHFLVLCCLAAYIFLTPFPAEMYWISYFTIAKMLPVQAADTHSRTDSGGDRSRAGEQNTGCSQATAKHRDKCLVLLLVAAFSKTPPRSLLQQISLMSTARSILPELCFSSENKVADCWAKIWDSQKWGEPEVTWPVAQCEEQMATTPLPAWCQVHQLRRTWEWHQRMFFHWKYQSYFRQRYP